MKRFSLDELRDMAAEKDVSWYVQNQYRAELVAGVPEVQEILQSGHVSEAISWLKSTSPEGMEFGTATRDERIDKAAGHAAAAGYPLEFIAEKHDLTDLL